MKRASILLLMIPRTHYSTWAEINLEAIQNNIRYYVETTQREVMAVVKANAYGHGAKQVANAALNAGASWLAVARVGEARELRESGLQAPILILGHTPFERVREMINAKVSLTVWEQSQLEHIVSAAEGAQESAHLHLKVDTGMSRLGVQPEQALGMARAITEMTGAHLEGVFTHYARADQAESDPTDQQAERFEEVVEGLTKEGLRPSIVHSANSAAGLKRPGAWYDLVRVGIAMYGLHPSAQCQLPEVFRAALSWKSTLAMVKKLPAGRGVSYGHIYETSQDERIGTIPVGYADGYRRTVGNEVLVHGVKVPVVGRVTMDQIMINLDDVPQAKRGDEVVLIGTQKGARITAEQVAEVWDTINYEVVSALAARVPRIYL